MMCMHAVNSVCEPVGKDNYVDVDGEGYKVVRRGNGPHRKVTPRGRDCYLPEFWDQTAENKDIIYRKGRWVEAKAGILNADQEYYHGIHVFSKLADAKAWLNPNWGDMTVVKVKWDGMYAEGTQIKDDMHTVVVRRMKILEEVT